MKKMAPNQRLPRWSLVDRDAYLMQACAGRSVVHLACASSPFTRELHEQGHLLHGKLSHTARQIAGIDLDADSLAYLRAEGFSQLFQADLMDQEALRRVVHQMPWIPDVIVIGELLEHLDQPGVVLENCVRVLGSRPEILITVPNAFSLKAMMRVAGGCEKVSHDHVSYFSWATLRQLIERFGLQIRSGHWYRTSFRPHIAESFIDLLLTPVLWFSPQLSDGVIVRCHFNGADERSGVATSGLQDILEDEVRVE